MMNIVAIETDEQLERYLALRKEVFVREQQVPEYLEIDEFDASPSACRHWMIEKEGLPVAAGRWRLYEPGVAKLQRIAVKADRRGQGYGAAIVGTLERDARAAGMSSAVLEAQRHAEPFYRKLGYETISDTFMDAGIEHVRMQKRLV